MNKGKAILGVTIGLVVLALVVPGLLPTLAGVFAAPTSATPFETAQVMGSSPGYVLTSTTPHWNSGNLCMVQTSGSTLTCRSSPPVKCDSTPQYYNFYGNGLTINIRIIGHDHCAIINIRGYGDTINLRVIGSFDEQSNHSRGEQTTGFIALAIYGEMNVLNARYTGSHFNSTFYFYQDHNTLNLKSEGSYFSTQAYFVGARGHFATGTCPYKNASRTDVANLWTTGSHNTAVLTWVNAVGYSTALAYGAYPGHGHFNTLGRENYSGSFTCGWLAPPPSGTNGLASFNAGVVAAVHRL